MRTFPAVCRDTMLRWDPPLGKRLKRILAGPPQVSTAPPLPTENTLAPSPVGGVQSPLWAVYLFTFLNSLGTGVVTNGIVFLTKQGYHFSDTMNYLLAVVLGGTYIAGALLAEPGAAWLRRRRVSSRAILTTLMLVMALLGCALPQGVIGGFLNGAEMASQEPVADLGDDHAVQPDDGGCCGRWSRRM